MVPTRFAWPHGGRQVYLSGSFTGWTDHRLMTPVEGSSTVFQTIFNLVPGYHKYKFLVDGVWRLDEQQPYISDESGTVNNIILVKEPEVVPLMFRPETPSPKSSMDVDDGIFRNMVFALDAKDPVKEAFHIMYEHGLAVMPIWDDSKRQFSGMLTASDFILILTELHKNGSMLTNEELEMHTVSAWKEGKSHLTRELNGPMHPSSGRPLIQAGPLENLKDLALRILHSNISTVPIIHTPEDGSYPQLLYLACLSGILKCMFSLSHYSSVMSIVCFRAVIPFIGHSGCCYSPPVVLFCQINQTFNTSDENDLYLCRHFRHSPATLPILQQPVGSLPIGTWIPEIGRESGRELTLLRPNTPLSSAFILLMEGKCFLSLNL
ncbi:hypothetical protein GIB67_012409 [Kingdonia uniflora]|uniref:CBS domain-containing protein n=1 Tax=Kingdonia uniflora TaxID=39325 RepID=A0A7J7LM44_9MAGN|nr:hypothetical protein GIB67_012409 [Kingdonia uniflora]